ncbi:S41 family peptidase [Opitutus terrae]|uniref:Carboxyl-terminal protease n=1 Tax=Opitutus terrae (strain DSM 11246 / JCM 15787 / PB90-1) TaxID=452637 RepID=B1ZYG0_OPITP|nr:S41 family peptidase [Opitutus terrae]ACB77058.1 carboxyl-terminal protease [Opitutus terrae PB90-1]
MFRRILVLAVGVALGFALTVTAARLSLAWSWWPNRELNRSTDYVRDVLRMVNENYVDAGRAGYRQLAKQAVHGMVESLDPHSEFLEPGDFDELEEQLTGDFSGIGIQVELRKGHVLVIAPIANSPSERAGVQRGDEILSVDGKGLDKESPMEGVIENLRGKPGTQVTIELLRASTGQRFRHTLTRELIQLESVRAPQVLADHTGYILITDFSERTGEEFGRALDTLLQEGVDSLVIDLRNNPGGLLDAAVAVAEPFFRRGELIVYTRGRKAIDSESFHAEVDGEPLDLPVVVLINAGTASAAEVVTGALKDTGRAVVLGERSFGKGSVQSIFKLNDGEGLRLTTARYFTPNGISIHEKGIAPHVELVLSPEEDSKLRVQRTRPDVTDPAEFKARFGFTPIEDRQLAAALGVLRGIKLLDQRRTVAAAGEPVAHR